MEQSNLTSMKHSLGFTSFGDFITKWGTILTIFILVIFFSISMPGFMSPSNMVQIFRSISIVTVIAIGLTISLTVGGFDLSVGSVATFADSLIISMFVWNSMPAFPAIIVSLIGVYAGRCCQLLT